MAKSILLPVLIIFSVFFSSCLSIDQSSASTSNSQLLSRSISGLPTPVLTVITSTPSSIPPTITNTPHPSETPSPTFTTTVAQPHPLTIEYLRQQDYPASDIIIEETLERGANYSRYITSYQSESLKIYALLTIPDGDPPDNGWPVIIFNHGYIPPSQYRTTERYVAYVDAFARSGYIVFRSDYRGHGKSEGVPRGAYGSPDYTIDVLNAISALKAYPLADPNRIGMWGHSMGGWITLRAMVVNPDIKAGVIWAGVVASYPDLLTKWRRGSTTPGPTPTGVTSRGRWRNSLSEIFGDFEDDPSNWAPLSANSFLDQLSGPIQLHHGTADTEVPLEFSDTLTQQIREVEGIVEYYTYEGDNHNISINFGDAMFRSIDFFNRYLKNNQ